MRLEAVACFSDHRQAVAQESNSHYTANGSRKPAHANPSAPTADVSKTQSTIAGKIRRESLQSLEFEIAGELRDPGSEIASR